ncbi:MAG TPA: trigger factor [Bacteroidales bacterium]|nr:trigger factor [Bacteroidales bacterium]
MQITREDTGHLCARVKITIEEKDYSENVEKQLREHRRKARVPGFRPGMAPVGMLKRIYGKSFLVDEVNRLLTDAITNHIKQDKLDIIGHPLAVTDEAPALDWDHPGDYEFWFDLGLLPGINIELESLSPVVFYDIVAGDDQVDKYVEDLSQRFGDKVNPAETQPGDILKGYFVELDETGGRREGGIEKETSLGLDFVKDEEIRSRLTGMKVGDSEVFNPLRATGHAGEVAAMLDIPREEAENLEKEFRFSLLEISRVEKASMDEAFFSRVFPTDPPATEEDFRQRVRDEISRSLSREAETHFFNEALEVLMQEDRFDLPVEFLKRWLVQKSEKEYSPEELEAQLPPLLKSMRWQVLQQYLMEKYNIVISTDDIRLHIQSYFMRQFGFPGGGDGGINPSLAPIIDNVMKDEEEVGRIHDRLTEDRLVNLFMDKVPQERRNVGYEEFIRIVKEANPKDANQAE